MPASEAAWPKLLVNLRASRETELLLEHAEHVVHAWIGHSKEVSEDHCAMVIDEDERRAATANPARTDSVASPAARLASLPPEVVTALRIPPTRSRE